jgi:hypothetical protein
MGPENHRQALRRFGLRHWEAAGPPTRREHRTVTLPDFQGIGHARVGLLVGEDPDDQHKRILAMAKCNLAAKPKSLRFALEPTGEVCRIGWCGESNYVADSLVAQPLSSEEKEKQEEAKTKVKQARAILEMIRDQSDGNVEIKAARAECYAAGLTLRAIERAIAELDWTVHYEIGTDGKRTYYWSAKT